MRRHTWPDDIIARLAPLPKTDHRIDQWEATRLLAKNALDAATLAEMTARTAKLRAQTVLAEIEVRLELLREELGIEELEEKEGES